MEIACVEGIAALARADHSAEVAAAYQRRTADLRPRLPDPETLRSAPDRRRRQRRGQGRDGKRRGHAPDRRPRRLQRKLDGSVFRSALIMRPVFEAAATASRRIVFAEGEDERVLRAAKAMLEETTDKPILIGRPEVIEARAERAGLPIRPGTDFELVNPENDPRYRDYWDDLPRADGSATASRPTWPGDHAHQHHRHRRGHGASRRGRQHDLRHLRPISVAPELHPAGAGHDRICTRSARCR